MPPLCLHVGLWDDIQMTGCQQQQMTSSEGSRSVACQKSFGMPGIRIAWLAVGCTQCADSPMPIQNVEWLLTRRLLVRHPDDRPAGSGG